MRAALIREVGSAPEVGEAAAPEGADSVDVLAAPLNPIDLAVSRGILATGHPDLPYVPGCEGVGRTGDGRLVWLFGGSLGRTANGTMAERTSIGDAFAIDVPDGADPAVAAGLGIAGLAGWLPFAWRAPLEGGENVLVLGATGSVGLVAVQTAKLLGAGRVVAAGRSAAGLERAVSAGADATVRLDEADDLVAAFKDAFGGDGPSYVFDPLWGAPGGRGGPGGGPVGADRQPRPVGRRDLRPRVGCGPLQVPLDPRAHELRRARRRARGPLPPARRPRDRRRHPVRGRARPARRRFGRVATPGGRRRREARRRAVGHSGIV